MNSKEYFKSFKEGVLNSFEQSLIQQEKNNLFNTLLSRGVIKEVVSNGYKWQTFDDYKSLLNEYIEKNGVWDFSLYIHCPKYLAWLKNKFELEMNLIEKLLDNNQTIYISKEIYMLDEIIRSMLSPEENGVGKSGLLDIIIFSERKYLDLKKIRDFYVYSEIKSFDDLNEEHYKMLSANIFHLFSNGIAVEEIENPLYEEYFNKQFKKFNVNLSVDKLKRYELDAISDLEYLTISLLEESKNISEEIKRYFNFSYENNEQMKNIRYKIISSQINNANPALIGDLTSEYVDYYKSKILKEKELEINERFLVKKENIDVFFEEFNIIDLNIVFIPYDKYAFRVNRKEEECFTNRFWQNILLKEKTKCFLNLIKQEREDVKICLLRECMFLLEKNFNNYLNSNKSLDFSNEKVEFEELLRECIVSFKNKEEATMCLYLSDFEENNGKKIDNNMIFILQKIYLEEKAKLENRNLIDVIFEEDIEVSKEFNMNSILILLGVEKTNDLINNIKNLNGKTEFHNKSLALGIDIYLRDRIISGNKLENIVISLNSKIINVSNKQNTNKLYESLLNVLSQKNFTESTLENYYRECLINHQLRYNDDKEFINKKRKI